MWMRQTLSHERHLRGPLSKTCWYSGGNAPMNHILWFPLRGLPGSFHVQGCCYEQKKKKKKRFEQKGIHNEHKESSYCAEIKRSETGAPFCFLEGRLAEDDGKTAGDCGKTTGRLWEDDGETVGRLAEDCGKTTGRLWEDYRKTTGRLQEDCRNTMKQLPKTLEDDRKEGHRKRTWFFGLLVC